MHLLSVATYGGHRSVMRSDKSPRSVSRLTLCLRLGNLYVISYGDIEHGEAKKCLIDLFPRGK